MYAAVNLVSLYNDAVIARGASKSFFEAASPTAKYSTYMAAAPEYRAAATALAVLQAAELILEMLAKKRLSDASRWRVVLALELAK